MSKIFHCLNGNRKIKGRGTKSSRQLFKAYFTCLIVKDNWVKISATNIGTVPIEIYVLGGTEVLSQGQISRGPKKRI
jgi:hypothetical protein